jgi:pyruvate,water dikinase
MDGAMNKLVVGLEEVGNEDVAIVGGKNASLVEMINSLSAAGVKVPGGFATTAQAYREFLSDNGLDIKICRGLM